MGRNKKARSCTEELFDTIAKMLAPVTIIEDFDICGVKEFPDRWLIEMSEEEDRYKVCAVKIN